jgi:hypothetical protein
MKLSLGFAVIAAVFVTYVALANTNLNSSRSNVYRVTYSTDLASKPQISALLAALDKLGPTDEAKLKQWLPANFRRCGIDPARIKKLIIMRPGKDVKETSVILLTNPADEAQARSTTVKSSKSNSSD